MSGVSKLVVQVRTSSIIDTKFDERRKLTMLLISDTAEKRERVLANVSIVLQTGVVVFNQLLVTRLESGTNKHESKSLQLLVSLESSCAVIIQHI